MAIFYVRASNDVTPTAGNVSQGDPKHLPFPGYKYDVADAAAAAAAYLVDFPNTAAGVKLIVTPDASLSCFVVSPKIATPSSLPTYV